MFVVIDLTCTCTPYLLFKVDQLAGSGVRNTLTPDRSSTLNSA